ncbi:MAG: hypothetical protein DHS20C13_03930 [Thermodesulfobacteriota bacterium]|nr:MAG: hypothetical protein DHS20C13_03930 [Thermodesulfobacteriota bacterium]
MKYIIALVIIAVLLFYFFIPAGEDKDAAGKIEIVLNNLIESGERKDLNVVMEYFSPDYKDSSGRTILVVRDIIQSAFDRFESIEGGYSNLIVSTTEDEVGDTQTIANLDIWISGNNSKTVYKLIGTKDKPQNVDIVFESLMLGGWKILSVENIK